MKATNYFKDGATSPSRYEAPMVEIVEIAVEHGFEASNEYGFEGPSYDEEDVIW